MHCTVGTQERAPSESRVAVLAERLNTEAGKLTKIIIILIIIKGHLLPSAKRAGARAPVEPYLCTCLHFTAPIRKKSRLIGEGASRHSRNSMASQAKFHSRPVV